MKQFQFLCLFLIAGISVRAQQVPRRVVAEHFTNSYCSICANRNPALYQNLSQFPQVLHLAIYPSAPYAACPINQYNKQEQDARTNYYGVYGSTPRLLVQGVEFTGSFSSASLFQSQLNTTSSFAADLSVRLLNPTTGEARLVIIKKDASTIDSLKLYAVLAYDTLNFTSNNGEAHHYDVFRKSIWGLNPVSIALPLAVGDSMIYTKTFTVNADWISNHIYATAMLQRADKSMEQAARSNALQIPSNPTGVGTTNASVHTTIYPNPAVDKLYINMAGTGQARIYDLQGRKLQDQNLKEGVPVIVSSLVPGCYLLVITCTDKTIQFPFIKQ